MAGKPSARMQKAMELVRAGLTPYLAAERAGVAKSTMYRSVLYRTWQDEIEAKKKPRRAQIPSPEMILAVSLTMGGTPPAEAARQAGVARSSLYQSGLYRAWLAQKKTAAKPA